MPPTGCASSFSRSAVEAPGLSGLMSLTRSSAISHRMLKSEQLSRGRLPGGVSSWQTFCSLCWKISLFLTHEMNVKAVPHTLSWNACHSARSLEQPRIHIYVLTYLYYIYFSMCTSSYNTGITVTKNQCILHMALTNADAILKLWPGSFPYIHPLFI